MCLVLALVNRALSGFIHDGALCWAAAFTLVELLATISIFACLLGRRSLKRFQNAIYDQIRPSIEDRVMALAFDGAVWSTAVPKQGHARFVLEQCLAHALRSLKDSGRHHVAQFAIDQGFARQWEKAVVSRSPADRKHAISLLGLVHSVNRESIMQTALRDSDSDIRTEAARALLRVGDEETIDQVFRSLLRESLLIRVLLIGDLKKHARYLLSHTIPSVLGSHGQSENNQQEVLNCLEILSIWKLALPALNAAQLLEQHGAENSRVLPLIMNLLPYLVVGDSVEQQIASALASPHADLDVQCAAAHAAGRLKLDGLIPMLDGLLSQQSCLALASATAMAQMGTRGASHLAMTVAGPDRKAAAAALEALEAITLGTR